MRIVGPGLSLVVACLAIGAIATSTQAATKECKAAKKCRGAIVSRTSKATKAALKQIDKCHKNRDAGKFSGDCNTVGASVFSKAAGLINKRCPAGNPVRSLFADDDPVGAVGGALATILSRTAQTVQGSPTLAGDKQKIKCHKTIGSVRTKLVSAALQGGINCQKVADATAVRTTCEFGSAAICANTAPSQSTTGSARSSITRACGGLSGDDVGSCSPFPDCVIDSALQTAKTIVNQMYSTSAECGDGIVAPTEDCDDGNQVPDDACSNFCAPAECHDLVVQRDAGEECDAPNDDQSCVECKLARCGDGHIRTDGDDPEQCDDGNDIPDDGCTNCKIDAVSCDPAVGYRVTVSIDYDQDVADLSNVTPLILGYPVGVSIPGTGQEPSVQQRVVILGNPSDFSYVANDQDKVGADGIDDTLSIAYLSLADTPEEPKNGIPPGDQVEIRFDCAQGAKFSGDDFTCVIPPPDPANPGSCTSACTIFGTPVEATCSVRVSAP